MQPRKVSEGGAAVTFKVIAALCFSKWIKLLHGLPGLSSVGGRGPIFSNHFEVALARLDLRGSSENSGRNARIEVFVAKDAPPAFGAGGAHDPNSIGEEGCPIMDFDPPLQLLLGLLVGRMRFFLGEIPCLNKFRGLDALLVTADAFESKWGKRQGVVLNSLAPMVIDSISPSPADLVVEDLAPDALLDQARVEIRREKSGRAGAAVESRGMTFRHDRRNGRAVRW
jgi:hypothetical protein